MKVSKNVPEYIFEYEAFRAVSEKVNSLRSVKSPGCIFLVDSYFSDGELVEKIDTRSCDFIEYVSTKKEPTTNSIDAIYKSVKKRFGDEEPCSIVGIGGGITLDTAKAVSNLLTNGGKAEDYQGWDLVKKPGLYKIGVPTLSGTGAEASRTCVITNEQKNIKLGMNSQHSIFDFLILDPVLTKTVPREQYFYTGFDTYIHCIESLNGSYRHLLADSFSHQAIELCREVFLSTDMMTDENRGKLMVASYLGGASIANTYVGLVHPLSAGLSTVFGTHHCIGNCIALQALEEFYPEEVAEFNRIVDKQRIVIPKGICENASEETFNKLYESIIVHEKPLMNALGDDYREILTYDKVKSIFLKM